MVVRSTAYIHFTAMSSNNVSISVVIPTYDRPVMLEAALKSVLNQTIESFEVVVVDDGSPRSLERVVESFDDDRIRFHRLDANRGANVARRRGIELAEGEYIAFLDDDDRWRPTKLEKQREALETARSAGVAVTGQRLVDEEGDTLDVKTPTFSGDVTRYLLKGGYVGGYSTVIVRSDLVEAAGSPDPELPIRQDTDWWLTLSSITEFVAIPEPLVVRRFGEYDQIGDRYEDPRDVACPRIYRKHGNVARAEGRRYQYYFKSRLLETVGRAALASGRYAEARYYLFHALLYRPWSDGLLVRFLVSLGGKRAYGTARSLRDYARKVFR